jgi:hypothetical protein
MKTRKVLCLALLLLAATAALGQKRETYQATARGTSTQMGRMFSVNIIINSYSTDQEREMLIGVFQKGGSQALSQTMWDMPSKGRIAITGTLGFDIAYVRSFPTPTGRKIRILTTRPVRMVEARNDTRSSDYDLSALELDLGASKNGNQGVLFPACQFKIGKQSNELEIEAFENPWTLTNVIDWNK